MEGKKDTVNKVIMECTVNSGIISPTLYYPIKKKKKSPTLDKPGGCQIMLHIINDIINNNVFFLLRKILVPHPKSQLYPQLVHVVSRG